MACALVVLGALASAARAGEAQLPCQADVRTLCAKVAPGGGRIQACLEAHESELSTECRNRLDGLGREAGLPASRCRWDVAEFCTDVPLGGGHVLQCLQTNEDQLSPECRSALREAAKP